MLLTKEVEIKLGGSNIKHLENLGYEIPRHFNNHHKKIMVKQGTKIIVKTEDLLDGAYVLVDVQCDGCGEILKGMKWSNYIKYVHSDKKYYCRACGTSIFGEEKARRTRLKNSTSFYQWCYINLPKEEADIIISRWDNELNIGKDNNKLTPQDVSFSSAGLNGKGYWFKCLDNSEHQSEQKYITNFTSKISKEMMTCNQCNSISITHPHLVKYLINKEDAYKYSMGSHINIAMKCPKCGYDKELSFNKLIYQGFACPRCSDGKPYPEKFMFNMLEQLTVKFQTELSKTTFEWCDKYKYDFYINRYNIIIETHGIQHYKESNCSWQSLEEIQENDNNKESLAIRNNINNYIVVDCRKSEINLIKDNIMKSDLPRLLNFKEPDIDWIKCHEYGCNSMVKVACDLWNSGIKSTLGISKELKMDRSTIIIYLKRGVELGWCDYNIYIIRN